jgi:Ca2+-dependent lipid-binding protein
MQATNDLCERIELFLSCRSLKDLDVFSKSDPYIKVSYKRDFSQQHYTPLGRTETIKNNINPNFSKTFPIDYIFESRQDIRFDVYDDDDSGNSDDFIGYVETTVGNLMGAQSQTAIFDLKSDKKENKPLGKMIVRCEKIE